MKLSEILKSASEHHATLGILGVVDDSAAYPPRGDPFVWDWMIPTWPFHGQAYIKLKNLSAWMKT